MNVGIFDATCLRTGVETVFEVRERVRVEVRVGVGVEVRDRVRVEVRVE